MEYVATKSVRLFAKSKLIVGTTKFSYFSVSRLHHCTAYGGHSQKSIVNDLVKIKYFVEHSSRIKFNAKIGPFGVVTRISFIMSEGPLVVWFK